MEELPIFSFSQWVVVNGGTIRIKDGEFEPIDKLPDDIWEYREGGYTNIYQKDGVEKYVQWDPNAGKLGYYEKYSPPHIEVKQRNIPREIISLLHSTPEPIPLTQICVMLGISRKEGRLSLRQLRKENNQRRPGLHYHQLLFIVREFNHLD